MQKYTKEQIEARVREIWNADWYYDEASTLETVEPPQFVVVVSDDRVDITMSRMYESPSLNLSHLVALSEFFGTKNINDDERFGYAGCETCDYGSSYGFTLTVRPEGVKP